MNSVERQLYTAELDKLLFCNNYNGSRRKMTTAFLTKGEGYRTDVLFNCNKMSQLFYSLPQQMKAIAFFTTLSTCGTNFRKLCICILGLLVLQHFPRTLSFTVYFLPWFKFPNSFTLLLSELNSI